VVCRACEPYGCWTFSQQAPSSRNHGPPLSVTIDAMSLGEFLTSGTAPWWATILGGVVGGLIAMYSTRASDNRKLLAADQRLVMERDRDATEEWRRSVMAECIAFYRLSESARMALIRSGDDPGSHETTRAATASRFRDEVSALYLEMAAHKFTLGVLGADDLRELVQTTSDTALEGIAALQEPDPRTAVNLVNDELRRHQFEFRQAVRESLGLDRQSPLFTNVDGHQEPIWNYGGK